LAEGEIHALIGENGAGKSTCLGLLNGVHKPTLGEIYINGERVIIDSTGHAQSLGISCVFQELSLASKLSVAENIYAGRAPTRFGIVNWKELNKKAQNLLNEFGLDIDVSQSVDSLPISTRQIIEIAKAISLDSKILLLDEPTSALTPDEVQALFKVLKKLAASGIGIVYVSHHMSEIFEISDKISVLRDGTKIATYDTNKITKNQVISDMIGSDISHNIQIKNPKIGDTIFELKNYSQDGIFEDIHFELKRGEILGLAGLLGSKRSEIVRSSIGLINGAIGETYIDGKVIKITSLRHAIKLGIGFVPEERKTEGLFLDFSVGDNLSVASLEQHSNMGIVQKKSIHSATEKAIEEFSVKTQGTDVAIGQLSGGNQQKIMLAKWLERRPKILIIEEPTKGVDIGAKFQIHEVLRQYASEGMAIIIISSDLPEIISLSTNIIAIHEGKITGKLSANETTEDNLMQLMAGTMNTSSTASASTQV
jgi:ABC-type sugar transport system ATPase subunit